LWLDNTFKARKNIKLSTCLININSVLTTVLREHLGLQTIIVLDAAIVSPLPSSPSLSSCGMPILLEFLIVRGIRRVPHVELIAPNIWNVLHRPL
jgi:hypothetical protein